MARRHSDVFVNLAADCSYRTVAYDRQRGAQVHARRETCFRMSLQIGALVGEPHARNRVVIEQWFGDRHARPDLYHARRCDLIADPLVELSQRKHEAVVFPHERGRKGHLKRVMLQPEQKS